MALYIFRLVIGFLTASKLCGKGDKNKSNTLGDFSHLTLIMQILANTGLTGYDITGVALIKTFPEKVGG